MDSTTYYLESDRSKQACLKAIESLRVGGSFEVVIRRHWEPKTLRQLRTVFGLWMRYLEDKTGYTMAELHRMHKRQFLEPIYRMEPANENQEDWLEAMWQCVNDQDLDRLEVVRRKISLKWATNDQMNRYMNDIERYYISTGIYLPTPNGARK